MNLLNFQKKFTDEQACINWLINERFGSKENMTCPHCNCNSAKTYDLQPTIYENVKEGSTIITEKWRAYNVLK